MFPSYHLEWEHVEHVENMENADEMENMEMFCSSPLRSSPVLQLRYAPYLGEPCSN